MGRAARTLATFHMVLLATNQLVWADSAAQNSHSVDPVTATSQARALTDAALQEHQARDWGLQEQEWTRYRTLMQGPLGIYSPNIDPLTALGIEARSEQERRHYAELQVRMEARRVDKLLAYQRAYDDAWRRVYPTLQPVNFGAEELSSSSGTDETASSRSGRLAIFVKDPCTPCETRVKALQAAGSPVDIYMVGSLGEDSRIREWAARVGIDPVKVRSRVITLNHDAGRWLKLGGEGDLPAVFFKSNGQWRRE